MPDDLEARAVAWLRIEESKSQFDMVFSPEDQFRHRAAMFAAFARHVLAGVEVCGDCDGDRQNDCYECDICKECPAVRALASCRAPTPCPACQGRGWTLGADR